MYAINDIEAAIGVIFTEASTYIYVCVYVCVD